MKKAWLWAGCLLLAQAAGAQILAEHAYARTTVAGQTQGGAFFTLYNKGSSSDRLLAVSVPPELAERAELHEHVHEQGLMKMQPVKGGIDVPAQGELALKPGGYHVMLFGLKKPLQAGQRFPLRLRFRRAAAQTLMVTVQPMAAEAAKPHHHHH